MFSESFPDEQSPSSQAEPDLLSIVKIEVPDELTECIEEQGDFVNGSHVTNGSPAGDAKSMIFTEPHVSLQPSDKWCHFDSLNRLANEQQSYVCNVCNKRFSLASSLESHIRIHCDDRLYICYHCNLRFSKASSLKAHVRIHSDCKPYRCERCGKSFTQSSYLKRHAQVHSGECNAEPYFNG